MGACLTQNRRSETELPAAGTTIGQKLWVGLFWTTTQILQGKCGDTELFCMQTAGDVMEIDYVHCPVLLGGDGDATTVRPPAHY